MLPYTVLKIFSFQDRHENKDAYDLVFTLLNHPDGPRAAGVAAAVSPWCDRTGAEAAFRTSEGDRWRLLFLALWARIHTEGVTPQDALQSLR